MNECKEQTAYETCHECGFGDAKTDQTDGGLLGTMAMEQSTKYQPPKHQLFIDGGDHRDGKNK